jgi:hypothetical protein
MIQLFPVQESQTKMDAAHKGSRRDRLDIIIIMLANIIRDWLLRGPLSLMMKMSSYVIAW